MRPRLADFVRFLPPVLTSCLLAVSFCLASARPATAATDEQVDQAIEKAIASLLKRQPEEDWTLRVYKRQRKQVLKKVEEKGRMVEKMQLEKWEEVPSETFRGQPVEDLPDGGIVFRKKDGQILRVPKPFIAYLMPAGSFHPERLESKNGGATCVATLALLEAGLSHHNSRIKAALRVLENLPLNFTYSRALRANIYALLTSRVRDSRERSHFRRLLHADMQWLERAMSPDGWYHYGAKAKRGQGDNSCTQFGVLGMWACANAGMEIPEGYWRVVERHWLETQGSKGAWSYVKRPPDVMPKLRPGDAPLKNRPRDTMTTAGVNTLYVVLDKLHARTESSYRWLKGVRPNPRTREAVAQDFYAINGGLKWMAQHGAAKSNNFYQLFGLERLGVASGLKFIGKTDWYAANVDRLVKHKWGGDPVVDGFYLIFLVYGRAPIVFNKLQWGTPDQWNYYFRDLHYLCRFLNREVERKHKWQIVSLASPLHDLRDAPILYVAGSGRFDVPKDHLAKLRDYCEAGGTVVGHPNRDDSKFAASFKKTMVDLFQDRGYRFETMGRDHPVFSTHFGKSAKTRFKRKVPVEGMSDGGRTFAFCFGGDIAGALHQNRIITYADAFRIMANIRFYAAGAYKELPGRLRPKGLPGEPAAAKGKLTIGRVKHKADWDANPTAWKRMGERLRHFQGVAIEKVKGVDPGKTDLASLDIVHITGHGKLDLGSSEQKALKDYIEAGGLVLIDAAAGDQDFATSAGQLVDDLYPDKGELLAISHPIVQGGPGGTKPLGKLRPTRWGSSRLRGRDAPPMSAVVVDNRVGLLYAPFDLTASMDGHFIYGMHGYKRESALDIMTNLLVWRFEQAKGK